jgi:hypothetical protein
MIRSIITPKLNTHNLHYCKGEIIRNCYIVILRLSLLLDTIYSLIVVQTYSQLLLLVLKYST